MTTSQQTPFISEALQAEKLSPRHLGYFRARLKNRLHELILALFLPMEQTQKVSRAKLAKKLSKKPEQITRWLGAPGNWELDTVSDLLLGMGFELQLSTVPIGHTISRPPAIVVPNQPQKIGESQQQGEQKPPKPEPKTAKGAAGYISVIAGLEGQSQADLLREWPLLLQASVGSANRESAHGILDELTRESRMTATPQGRKAAYHLEVRT